MKALGPFCAVRGPIAVPRFPETKTLAAAHIPSILQYPFEIQSSGSFTLSARIYCPRKRHRRRIYALVRVPVHSYRRSAPNVYVAAMPRPASVRARNTRCTWTRACPPVLHMVPKYSNGHLQRAHYSVSPGPVTPYVGSGCGGPF